jgi:hypothetical protein
MANALLEKRVTSLETSIADLTAAVEVTRQNVDRLSFEMREFKEEMREFKDEMSDFKDEMKEFKNEMRDFKDEMKGFKDDMSDFKDESEKFREENRQEQRRFNRELGDIANKYGRMTEDLVAPSVGRILSELLGIKEAEKGCLVNVRIRRRDSQHPNRTREFDAVADLGGYVLFNETRSNLTSRDVKEHIAKVPVFRRYFPEYKDHKLILSVASLQIDKSVINYATRHGVVALAVGHELMDILNGPDFRPKEF